jgi:uncharacterized protein
MSEPSYFAVVANDRQGCTALRAQTKEHHRHHLDTGATGLRVLQTGPLLDAHGGEIGSLLILEAQSQAIVEAFMAADPYVEAGLFANLAIYPWLWRRGNPYLERETDRARATDQPKGQA